VFTVIDPFKVTVRGDGLGLTKANQATSFVIAAPAADIPDLDVVITGVLSFVSVCLSILSSTSPWLICLRLSLRVLYSISSAAQVACLSCHYSTLAVGGIE